MSEVNNSTKAWRGSGGCHDCGGKCPYKVWVENGKAVRIEPYQDFRPCVRGYAYIDRVYSPERLKTPLVRSGERGDGAFKPISWEEALDLVAEKLSHTKARYGASSILCVGSSGAPGRLHTAASVFRLLNMFGGYTGRWGSASAEGAYFAAQATYGTTPTAHTRDDIIHSKLVLLWGWNPAETVQGSDTTYHLVLAKEKGTKFVSVDPRYTNTAALLADQWIPVRPGTDTALLLAMSFVIIEHGLQDQDFIDRYTVGFETFKDYLLGKEDGISQDTCLGGTDHGGFRLGDRGSCRSVCPLQTGRTHPRVRTRTNGIRRAVPSGSCRTGLNHRQYRPPWREPRLLRDSPGWSHPRGKHQIPDPDSHRSQSGGIGCAVTGKRFKSAQPLQASYQYVSSLGGDIARQRWRLSLRFSTSLRRVRKPAQSVSKREQGSRGFKEARFYRRPRTVSDGNREVCRRRPPGEHSLGTKRSDAALVGGKLFLPCRKGDRASL